MKYLTINEVIFLHNDFVDTYGGSQGIRDHELLESALFRPQTSFGGEDLYPTVFTKAAALLHGILFNHPFVDGNKRTAIGSAAALLMKNDWELVASLEELVAFPLAIEKTRPPMEDIADWLKEHSRKRKKRK